MEVTISKRLAVIQKDVAVGPYPASLYTALLTCWQQQGFPDEICISRRMLMPLAGIRAFATYHKSLRLLINCGYIDYKPSYHNRLASKVSLKTIKAERLNKAAENKEEIA